MTRPAVRHLASRDNPLLIRLRKLADDSSAYRKFGEIWIEGEHLCSAWHRHGQPATQAVITESGWQQPPLRALANTATGVAVVPDSLMASSSPLESPASIGFVVPWAGPGMLDADAPTAVLDRLQDAGNVGTILRSAAAFGIVQVVATVGTATLWSPKVLRAGMGAHFGLRLVESVSEVALHGLRVPLLATSPHAERTINRTALPWPCAWVLGHEGQGVSADLLTRCAMTLRIPQPGGEESLNVAAAAAVCFYESVRQRS